MNHQTKQVYQEAVDAIQRAKNAGLTQGQALDVLCDVYGEATPEQRARLNLNDDQDLDGRSLVSECDDGVWVSGWLWAQNPPNPTSTPDDDDAQPELDFAIQRSGD